MTAEKSSTAGPTAAVPSPWNIANALTVLRILLVPVFGWLLLSDGGADPSLRYWAAFAFAGAMLTDSIDGDLARRHGLVTDFGKVVDPIADKALIGMALVGLSILGEIPWWVTTVILVREWGVTALRFFVMSHGVIPASRGGKLKTALQGVALLLYILPLWTLPTAAFWHGVAWVVLLVAVVVTVVTGVDYVRRALVLRRTADRAVAGH
jgi:CDP-diacylglycerol---glycerol-3-phosphate 3-phosphatidyltransferase